MSEPRIRGRERITWTRTERNANGLPIQRISHPWAWIVVEPDGYERCFDTKREAEAWIEDWSL